MREHDSKPPWHIGTASFLVAFVALGGCRQQGLSWSVTPPGNIEAGASSVSQAFIPTPIERGADAFCRAAFVSRQGIGLNILASSDQKTNVLRPRLLLPTVSCLGRRAVRTNWMFGSESRRFSFRTKNEMIRRSGVCFKAASHNRPTRLSFCLSDWCSEPISIGLQNLPNWTRGSIFNGNWERQCWLFRWADIRRRPGSTLHLYLWSAVRCRRTRSSLNR